MTLKRQKNKQHKDVLTDPQYRPKVVKSKKQKAKEKKVPKNKLLEEVFDDWVDNKLPPWEGEDLFPDEKELQEQHGS
jgi:hypothetical protein